MKVNRSTILLILAGLLVVAAIPGRFLMSYRSGLIDDKKEITAEAAALDRRIDTAQLIDSDLTRYERDLATIKAAFPERASFDNVLVTLSDLAARTGVTLEGATPSTERNVDAERALPDGVTAYFVSVSFSGSFPAAKAFLAGLNSQPRLFSATAVDVQFVDDGVIVSVPLRVYTWFAEIQSAFAG